MKLPSKRKKRMEIGDRFLVADYYSYQEDLVEFEITGYAEPSWVEWVKYKAKPVDRLNERYEHYFGDKASPDVWSAKVIATKSELKKYNAKRKDYERRKAKAMKIFPEGFYD